MDKFVINGGKKLKGRVSVSGAKNVALKAIVAACLTEEDVVIKNVPLISDFLVMAEIIKELGGKVDIKNHTASVKVSKFNQNKISLEEAAEVRTSFMLMVPLLARTGKALIPNPGGCRIGARPIDRVIEGLERMGVFISYSSSDGYFHAKIESEAKKLKGINYRFEKSTHTGTETMILASVLAQGKTVLENAAEEPEVNELISLLNKMGAKIERTESRMIVIEGVDKLHGAEFNVGSDRNEVVTFAVAAIITGGDVVVENVNKAELMEFLNKLNDIGGGFEELENGIRFYYKEPIKATDIVTSPYPGFMTDWQSSWAVLMTKAHGTSVIHEAVYENRFGYVSELEKMGAKITLFNPKVTDPKSFYNFNLKDDKKEYYHGVKIDGPINLHNGVVKISDLRAGATLVLAALAAKGGSVVFGIEHLDRGYEQFEKRLKSLGADIKRVKED